MDNISLIESNNEVNDLFFPQMINMYYFDIFYNDIIFIKKFYGIRNRNEMKMKKYSFQI